MKRLLTTVMLGMTINTFAAEEPAVIPRPQKMEVSETSFSLSKSATISTDSAFLAEAKFLSNAINNGAAASTTVKTGAVGKVQLRLNKAIKAEEGYKLTIDGNGIVIEAGYPAGAFYGVQTVLQMLPAEIVTASQTVDKLELPYAKVEDAPRFAWRAFMLDEARHFKGEKEVKKLLDQMAQLKMNVFHWHLTDDQGWRIEIKKYPKLTTIGSKRKNTQVGGWGNKARSGKPHEGFYTQEQIKDIVKYAAERHITIVPEIGMPGHASAAVAAYPELGTARRKIEVPVVFGKMYDTYNAADEKVYTMLSEILDEVVALFPSKVIHVGGDEVRFDQWKNSKEVQEMMKREGLKTMADVQIYFTNRMSKIIEAKGRRMMGWNEIMGDDLHGFLKNGQTGSAATLSKEAVIHFWKGSAKLAEKAILKGHDVINSWHSFTYLDYGYGSIGLGKAYNFDPIIKGLAPKYHSKIKGFGCQMWGEWIPTVERMEYQIYPRLGAYAEVGWTALNRKDFKGFKERMKVQEKRWDYQGIGYAKNIVTQVSAADFFNHVKIGTWSPKTVKSDFETVEWKTDRIDAAGEYEVAMLYKKGAHAIDIKWVALYEDGKEIAKDKHKGFSGGKLTNIAYKLKLPKFKAGAKYSIKALIKGSGGTDSNGEVKIQKN